MAEDNNKSTGYFRHSSTSNNSRLKVRQKATTTRPAPPQRGPLTICQNHTSVKKKEIAVKSRWQWAATTPLQTLACKQTLRQSVVYCIHLSRRQAELQESSFSTDRKNPSALRPFAHTSLSIPEGRGDAGLGISHPYSNSPKVTSQTHHKLSRKDRTNASHSGRKAGSKTNSESINAGV